jgi:hypothetical protein
MVNIRTYGKLREFVIFSFNEKQKYLEVKNKVGGYSINFIFFCKQYI